jgi:hypothetical protein
MAHQFFNLLNTAYGDELLAAKAWAIANLVNRLITAVHDVLLRTP